MKKWPLAIIIAGVGGLAVAFSLAQVLPNLRTTTSGIEVNIKDPQLIKKGEYIARTADCVACHTTIDGEDYAGGLSMLTQIGRASCRERV